MSETLVKAQNQSWLIAHEDFPLVEQAARERWTDMMLGLGQTAFESTVSTTKLTGKETTLMVATQLAAEGDELGNQQTKKNVSKDIFERLYKVGKTKVELDVVDDQLEQDGRALTSIHINTLKYTHLIPEMHLRTSQDLHGVLVFQELRRRGVTEHNHVLFISTSSTRMTEEEKKDYNFNLDTESVSMQLFKDNGSKVELETGMVAGKPTPDSERQDITIVQAMAKKHGKLITTNDGTEIQGYVIVIPKDELPNGLTNLIMEYDNIGGGIFYGKAAPSDIFTLEDYLQFAEKCEQQDQDHAQLVDAIATVLIQESSTFKTPLEAILRLDQLSEEFCLKYAIKNREINARVFGSVSAGHIENARYFYEIGEIEKADSEVIMAHKTANSGSCPLFTNKLGDPSPDSSSGSSNDEKSKKRFMKCPQCSAKIWGDPCAKVIKCLDCMAKVDHGFITNGNGGSKARAKAKQDEARRLEELAKQVEAIYVEAGIDEKMFAGRSLRKVGV